MRTWLVTGGSRGIGRAVAERALAAGDRVAVIARRMAAAGGRGQARDRLLELPADVTDPASLDDAFAELRRRWGGIDVLVNNAGVHRGGRLGRLRRGDWDLVLATNLTGPVEATTRVLPLMATGGAVINVGAVVGLRGFPGDAAYGAAKAGLAGLTRVLAIELAPRGVRVNLVVPGFIETSMTARLTDAVRRSLVDAVPLGRPGTEQEIAEVVYWVAGATYMTGATVPVDGGLLACFGARRPWSREDGRPYIQG